MRVTGTLQRESWLRAELPPVEKVAGGVWSVPVPIPDNPLRYVLSYLIEHDAGFVLVDPGWNHPDSWRALNDGMAACEVPMTAVTAILVTHVHPDHHGQSGQVREQSGAWIAMHPREDAFLEVRGDRGAMRDGMEFYLRWCGAPASHLTELSASRPHAGQTAPMVRADRLIEHGELINVPGLRLRAVWTPGHTPGHLCFHDEGRDLLLTGDHILPRITPNISSYDMSSNPLDDYLASLTKLKGMQPAARSDLLTIVQEKLPEYDVTGGPNNSWNLTMKPSSIADLKDWHITGYFTLWMTLDPTDALLLLRDVGSDDIYALTLDEK